MPNIYDWDFHIRTLLWANCGFITNEIRCIILQYEKSCWTTSFYVEQNTETVQEAIEDICFDYEQKWSNALADFPELFLENFSEAVKDDIDFKVIQSNEFIPCVNSINAITVFQRKEDRI